ncbi:DUF308 domain-containing protein [Synechococcus sp. CCY9201]|jgi:uncharacterized membrane protein HdeD (DUF308 family)|uniref:HdeD family acid-resistance protein n=1 Tax=unclassified Synechococcus TaxID=2626047 RepID=UPI0018CD5A4A|nr:MULTISPECIES: DUF308 domain-containing protein [unclassified Synechococcus]MEA5423368.1 DUF308 domain-containing protein [Synechococcus sp. CCY9202]MEA5473552.1 DUF308 domain-containing protein [Synechococcus sp. CCY9201]QPN58603.1 DUF308 domain-containing protein [Synechococcus sp. CBW1002]CAK6699968.1 hypothetical protein IFHNHDMJ_02745 [Synechococcus sp. CBW1107]
MAVVDPLLSVDRGLRSFALAEGILMLVLGLLALFFPVVASIWVTAMVAVAFLVGGLVGWITNLLRARQLRRWLTFSRLLVSTLFVVTGFWMLHQMGAGPERAAAPVASLALAVGLVFLVEGAVGIVASLAHQRLMGWGWGLVNGVVTLVLGLLILTMKFWNLSWVLGVLVGVSFLFSGLDLITFSASFHDGEAGSDVGG